MLLLKLMFEKTLQVFPSPLCRGLELPHLSLHPPSSSLAAQELVQRRTGLLWPVA